MILRRAVLFLFVALPGAAAVVVSGYYLFQDWSALISAFGRFEKAAVSGDLREVYIAGTLDQVYRINAFADGVGVMLGAVLLGIGLHGLCTLPLESYAALEVSRPARRVAAAGALLVCLVTGGVLLSLMRRVGLTNDLRRAVLREDVARVRQLVRSGADARDRLWWGKSALDVARTERGIRRESVLQALRLPRREFSTGAPLSPRRLPSRTGRAAPGLPQP